MTAKPIDPNRVRELFSYDEETGSLIWAKPMCPRMKPGQVAGCLDGDPLKMYWVIKIDGRKYRRARLVWAYVHGEDIPAEIDHIDRNKANDRVGNLRLATRSQNGVNRIVPKPFYPNLPRGVRPKRKHGEIVGYRGRIEVRGKRVDLGQYTTPERAGQAVQRALVAAHGAEWLPV